MSAPTIVILSPNEKPTAERINEIFAALQAMFGNLDGTDFIWPLVMGGDLQMGGNRILRAREVFGSLNLGEYGTDQDAFEQAVNELEGGGMIFIPRNTTITLTRSVKIRSNRQRIQIVGSGHSSQLKIGANADDPAIVVEGSAFFKIANLYINGNASENGTSSGIQVANSTQFAIENVWIGSPDPATGTKGPGIKISNSAEFRVNRSTLRNIQGPGIHINDGCRNFDIHQMTISDVDNFDDFKGDGILVEAAREFRIHACQINEVAANGIRLVRPQHPRVYGNVVKTTVTDPEDGISIAGENEANESVGVDINSNIAKGFDAGFRIGSFVNGLAHSNHLWDNDYPIVYDGAGDTPLTLRNNLAFQQPAHGCLTMAGGQSITHLDIGVANIPIQAIHATWKYSGSVSNLSQMVLSAAYAVLGSHTITFHTATTKADAVDFWYSIFI